MRKYIRNIKKKEQKNDTMETFVLYEECLRFFLLKSVLCENCIIKIFL